MSRAVWAAALAALALLAACGSDDDPAAESRPAPAPAPADEAAAAAVTAAFERLEDSSYRLVATDVVRNDLSRIPEDLRDELRTSDGVATTRLAVESAERARGEARGPGVGEGLTLTFYDGDTFVTLEDGDVLRLTGDLGEAYGQLAEVAVLRYADALEDVRARGTALLEGRRVRRYSAELSQELLDELVGGFVGGFGIDPGAVDWTIRSGRLVVDLLPSGDLARVRQNVVSEIDLSDAVGQEAIDVTAIGSDQRISDIGAPIVVERPSARADLSDPEQLARLLGG